MDFNSIMICCNRCSRRMWSFIAVKSGRAICEYAKFSFWISAISCLSASIRSRMPSINQDYPCEISACASASRLTPVLLAASA
jgi:hypothetical protein